MVLHNRLWFYIMDYVKSIISEIIPGLWTLWTNYEQIMKCPHHWWGSTMHLFGSSNKGGGFSIQWSALFGGCYLLIDELYLWKWKKHVLHIVYDIVYHSGYDIRSDIDRYLCADIGADIGPDTTLLIHERVLPYLYGTFMALSSGMPGGTGPTAGNGSASQDLLYSSYVMLIQSGMLAKVTGTWVRSCWTLGR